MFHHLFLSHHFLVPFGEILKRSLSTVLKLSPTHPTLPSPAAERAALPVASIAPVVFESDRRGEVFAAKVTSVFQPVDADHVAAVA